MLEQVSRRIIVWDLVELFKNELIILILFQFQFFNLKKTLDSHERSGWRNLHRLEG